MARLLEVTYFTDASGNSKKIVFGARANDVFYIQPFSDTALFRGSKVATVNGEEIVSNENWEMTINTAFLVPIVDALGNPKMIPNPDFNPEAEEGPENPAEIQKTIPEWEMWRALFWEAPAPVSMKDAISASVLRRLGLNPDPLVYVEI